VIGHTFQANGVPGSVGQVLAAQASLIERQSTALASMEERIDRLEREVRVTFRSDCSILGAVR